MQGGLILLKQIMARERLYSITGVTLRRTRTVLVH
jgi:hypothetical protein